MVWDLASVLVDGLLGSHGDLAKVLSGGACLAVTGGKVIVLRSGIKA